MKVILTEAVRGTGNKGEVVEVTSGYAKNFLLKKGLARPLTVGAAHTISAQKKKVDRQKKKKKRSAESTIDRLRGKTVLITGLGANEEGKLYAAVSRHVLAAELSAQFGVTVAPKDVLLQDTIKQLGKHIFRVRVTKDVDIKLSCQVSA